MQTFKYLPISQHERTFYLTMLPAGIVTHISYASIRGQDDEEGAVQRILNSRRINSIKQFALNGGDFPSAIVMNWTGRLELNKKKRTLKFDSEEGLAQLIDGQHRVAGLREAISEQPAFAKFEVPVAIYESLNTRDCAEIFLAINTEQKPVPRSLVFDLYGILGEEVVDGAIVRAGDIARSLNEDGAPYRGMIKFPGERPRKGGVALSTVVTSIRPLIEKNGVLDQIGLSSFENQSKLMLNYFSVLENSYGKNWAERSNALMYAGGFSGALEFLSKRMIPYCVNKKSFTKKTMSKVLQISSDNLIQQNEISGKGGTEAQRIVFNRLDEMFTQDENPDEFEI